MRLLLYQLVLVSCREKESWRDFVNEEVDQIKTFFEGNENSIFCLKSKKMKSEIFRLGWFGQIYAWTTSKRQAVRWSSAWPCSWKWTGKIFPFLHIELQPKSNSSKPKFSKISSLSKKLFLGNLKKADRFLLLSESIQGMRDGSFGPLNTGRNDIRIITNAIKHYSRGVWFLERGKKYIKAGSQSFS